MAKWGEIKCPRCEELEKAGISDAAIAQARRYYMHVQEGGTLTARDVGRMVEAMEVMQAKLAQQGNLVQAAVAAALREAAADVSAVSMDGDYLAERILALIPDGGKALNRVLSNKLGNIRAEIVRLSAEGKLDGETTERLLAAIRKGGE